MIDILKDNDCCNNTCIKLEKCIKKIRVLVVKSLLKTMKKNNNKLCA